jgi:hypothetical protein
MKIHFTTIGLAFCVVLAPIGALAQDTGQAGSSLDGTAASPDGTVPDTSANPFTGAAGADKFYQDNSLTGSAQSNNTGSTGTGGAVSNGSLGSSMTNSNPAGTLPTPDESSAADNANPFAGAAGANRFYQDNSLTGSMPTTNLDTLGGINSGMANWATTP